MRTAYLLTCDHQLAEDLVQSALFKAGRAWHRIEEPESYVRRILYTENVSLWRHRRGVVEASTEGHDGPPHPGPMLSCTSPSLAHSSG